MNEIREKIIDKIWTRIDPIITPWRIFIYLALIISVSKQFKKIYSIDTYFDTAQNFIYLISDIFKNSEAIAVIALIFTTFYFIPRINSQIFKYYLNNVHIKFSDPLITSIEKEINNQIDNQIDIKKSILIYNEKRKDALVKIERYKNIGELLISLFLLTMIKAPQIPFVVHLSFIIAMFVIYFFLSRKLLIAFISNIYPYNILLSKWNN